MQALQTGMYLLFLLAMSKTPAHAANRRPISTIHLERACPTCLPRAFGEPSIAITSLRFLAALQDGLGDLGFKRPFSPLCSFST
jgi:hypothetical protein